MSRALRAASWGESAVRSISHVTLYSGLKGVLLRAGFLRRMVSGAGETQLEVHSMLTGPMETIRQQINERVGGVARLGITRMLDHPLHVGRPVRRGKVLLLGN